MPAQLRFIFSTLLIYCEVHNAKELWLKFKEQLSEDFRHKEVSREDAEALAYIELDERLNKEGYSLQVIIFV